MTAKKRVVTSSRCACTCTCARTLFCTALVAVSRTKRNNKRAYRPARRHRNFAPFSRRTMYGGPPPRSAFFQRRFTDRISRSSRLRTRFSQHVSNKAPCAHPTVRSATPEARLVGGTQSKKRSTDRTHNWETEKKKKTNASFAPLGIADVEMSQIRHRGIIRSTTTHNIVGVCETSLTTSVLILNSI